MCIIIVEDFYRNLHYSADLRTLRMRTNLLLILGLCSMNLQQTLLEDVCYEKDKAPVELDVLYNDQCLDIQGVIYTLGSELVSCCDCFRYQCEELGTWDNHLKVRWARNVSAQCCQTCHGTVFPHSTVISTTELEDDCLTTKTEVCRVRPGLEKAVIELEFSYRNCCNDNNSKYSWC